MQSLIALILLAASLVSATPTVPQGFNETAGEHPDVPQANKWKMLTFAQTSCSGTTYSWSVPDGKSCTNVNNVESLKVTNAGGCKTTYYNLKGCPNNGSPVHVKGTGDCDGYAGGAQINSFQVICPQ